MFKQIIVASVVVLGLTSPALAGRFAVPWRHATAGVVRSQMRTAGDARPVTGWSSIITIGRTAEAAITGPITSGSRAKRTMLFWRSVTMVESG